MEGLVRVVACDTTAFEHVADALDIAHAAQVLIKDVHEGVIGENSLRIRRFVEVVDFSEVAVVSS